MQQYFKELSIPARTVYEVLKRYEEPGTSLRSEGSGRPAVKTNARLKERIIEGAVQKGKSQRTLANQCGITHQYVQIILSSAGYRAFKKRKVPFVSEAQQTSPVDRLGNLYRLCLNEGPPDIVMDEECYFTLRHDKIPGNSFYYARSSADAPFEAMLAPLKKFEIKLLLWSAISPRAISSPAFFLQVKGSSE